MGPLPTTESGNKYILVVGDYFTKWKEAFPLPNQEAKTVAEKLVNEVISRYRAPECIHSDQGWNFEAHLFQEMCRLFDMDKTRTTPYHPASDGMIEQMNRIIQGMLAKYVSDHQRDWDLHLPLVMMAYRSSVHASTQYTLNYLLFGHEVRLPVDEMCGRQPLHQEEVSEYVHNLQSNLEEVHEHAREHLRTSQRCQKDHYDQRVAGEQIKVGDRVFLHGPAVKKGLTRKLHSPWQGPNVVVTRISDVTYCIQAMDNPRKWKVVHFNRLKLCSVRQQVDQQPEKDPPVSLESSPAVRRPHLPQWHAPDEMETVAEMEAETPRTAQEPQGTPVRVETVPSTDRPRREVRAPIWMRDFVS